MSKSDWEHVNDAYDEIMVAVVAFDGCQQGPGSFLLTEKSNADDTWFMRFHLSMFTETTLEKITLILKRRHMDLFHYCLFGDTDQRIFVKLYVTLL